MRITSIQPELIREIPFLNAGRGPGGFYIDSLPVHHGFVDALPEGMSAIIATADLQGRETFESADGPDVPDFGFRGSPRIRHAFVSSEPTLVVRGHAHWNQPFAELSNGTQVLNVDARVVILTSEAS